MFFIFIDEKRIKRSFGIIVGLFNSFVQEKQTNKETDDKKISFYDFNVI